MNQKKKTNETESVQNSSSQEYRLIFDNVNDGIIIHDAQGRIFDINKNMYTRLGYTKSEITKKTLQSIVSPEFAGNIKKRTAELHKDGVAVFESGDIRKDGTVMPVEISAREIEYRGQRAILSVVRDITQRKMAEELIATTLAEKELLLKALQKQTQRVMQVFSLMLEHYCQKSKLPNELDVYQKMIERIKSYTHIYEKIYRYKNYSKIDFADFVDWQAKRLISTFGSGASHIHIKRDIQNGYLNIHSAIPCGLIVQELVSNALDHAFPDANKGTITVQLRTDSSGKHLLSIKDDGKGLNPDLNFSTANSLGFLLVKDFISEIDGTAEVSRTGGVEFVISFPNP